MGNGESSLVRTTTLHCHMLCRVLWKYKAVVWSFRRFSSPRLSLANHLTSHCFCFTICKTGRIIKKNHIESYCWKLGGSIIYHIKCVFCAFLFTIMDVNCCQSCRRPLLLLHRSSVPTFCSSSLGLADKFSIVLYIKDLLPHCSTTDFYVYSYLFHLFMFFLFSITVKISQFHSNRVIVTM